MLRSAGVEVEGPISADTVFSRTLNGEYDAVIAPYHDVGMAPFKTISFGAGVNVTLGLPFVRTSPDHGTAFEIVGSGKADPSSMQAALQMASRLVSRRLQQPSKRFDTLAAHT
jgi:4-hydroxythreonine-4-phosphate dehydrogenase